MLESFLLENASKNFFKVSINYVCLVTGHSVVFDKETDRYENINCNERHYAFFKSVLLTGVAILSAGAQDMLPSTSLVYPGVDGKLVYVADSMGNRIPDFSHAGYRGGGVAIPYVPNKATVWPVAGDNTGMDAVRNILLPAKAE